MAMIFNIAKEKFLKCYHHLISNAAFFFDIEFLYGGRDSGKSRHVAMRLVLDCMRGSYFRCLLIRKVKNTVRDSQFSLIKSILDEWGIAQYFSINESRMEIICKLNGNGFFGRGLDDVGQIKSFNNPSHCWVEEGNQIESTDLVVILTSLRSSQRVQTWFTFNPECEVNYTEFWLYQEWFEHTEELSWTWSKAIEVEREVYDKFPDKVIIKDGRYYIEYKVRATHTTYKDNPYCAPHRIALYESYKGSKNNKYWYQTYTLGLWGFRRTGGEFWKCFEEEKHTKVIPLQQLPFHVTVDINTDPYVTIALWQFDFQNKHANQANEIPCTHPNNTAAKAAKELSKYLQRMNYKETLFLYGDPSGNKRSTEDDHGRSFFDKFKAQLQADGWKIVDRIKKNHPPVSISGDFINEIYESNYGGWSIYINTECRKSIEDYTMTKEDMNGNVLKKRITDKATGKSYEKYGHFTDTKRYLLTTVLEPDFIRFQARRKRTGSTAA